MTFTIGWEFMIELLKGVVAGMIGAALVLWLLFRGARPFG
jgi:hypothetical protein